MPQDCLAMNCPMHGRRRDSSRSRDFRPRSQGGAAFSGLARDGRLRWEEAARTVNRELGHGEGRQDITGTYIGKKG